MFVTLFFVKSPRYRSNIFFKYSGQIFKKCLPDVILQMKMAWFGHFNDIMEKMLKNGSDLSKIYSSFIIEHFFTIQRQYSEYSNMILWRSQPLSNPIHIRQLSAYAHWLQTQKLSLIHLLLFIVLGKAEPLTLTSNLILTRDLDNDLFLDLWPQSKVTEM